MCRLCFRGHFRLLFLTGVPYLLCYVRPLFVGRSVAITSVTSFHTSVSTPVFTDCCSGKLSCSVSRICYWLHLQNMRKSSCHTQRCQTQLNCFYTKCVTSHNLVLVRRFRRYQVLLDPEPNISCLHPCHSLWSQMWTASVFLSRLKRTYMHLNPDLS